jgi:RNA polymerase sigma-70 factor (ECF subfamily)
MGDHLNGQLTDEVLVSRAREGDNEAFRELVKRHESLVAGTVIGMLGRCPEADDVGQETFIRFYRSLKNFRGRSKLGTYLTRIAINLSLNELKSRRRRSNRFVPKPVDEIHDLPDEKATAEPDENREIVHRALGRLETKFRSVIVLRLIDGYSTEETANILKIPAGTVLSRLSRAQKKLKDFLEPYYGDER